MKNMTPHPLLFASFPDFWQIWCFSNFFECLHDKKKANCIFKEISNLWLTVFQISFFPLLLRIATENRTKLKKLFIWTKNQVEHNTANMQTAPDYSPVTVIMLLIFWSECDFRIISDCSNSLNQLKNLWTRKNFL